MNDEITSLKNQIKNDKLSQLYVFYGEEDFLIDYYTKKICEKVPDMGFPEFNRIVIDGKEAALTEIADAVDTFAMMAPRKVVIISQSEAFSKSVSAEKKDLFVRIFENLSDDTVIVMKESSVDKRGSVYKSAKKHGTVVEFNRLNESDLIGWVMREVHVCGKTISKQNAMLLVSICEKGLTTLKNEIEKLSANAGDEITQTDINLLASRSLEARVFDLCDHIMNKDADKAISLLEDLKMNKESPFAILYILYNTFEKLLKAKVYSLQNMSRSDIAAAISLSPYVAAKYITAARGFSEDRLCELLAAVPYMDLSIKRGKISNWQAIESLVFKGIGDKNNG